MAPQTTGQEKYLIEVRPSSLGLVQVEVEGELAVVARKLHGPLVVVVVVVDGPVLGDEVLVTVLLIDDA